MPLTIPAVSVTNTAAKQPQWRSDIDIESQKLAVAEYHRERLQARLEEEGRLPTRSLIEFKRHGLRQLVHVARKHQEVASPTVPFPQPSFLAKAEAVLAAHHARPPSPVPEGHFDLKDNRNYRDLLADVDTLMEMAKDQPHACERIVCNTVQQVARLSLFHVCLSC